jgi:hypothetical protein
MCTPPLTFCGSCVGGLCFGECYDLSSDQEHCGSCTDNCGAQRGTSHGVCTYGICSRECIEGRADCNGNASDECEIDIDSDPRNCGGCGKACDLVAGQACVGGRCVVEPCKDDAGTETAR